MKLPSDCHQCFSSSELPGAMWVLVGLKTDTGKILKIREQELKSDRNFSCQYFFQFISLTDLLAS